MHIGIDASGGDYAPDSIIEGTILALNEYQEISVTLFGDQAYLSKKIPSNLTNRIAAVHSPEVITFSDKPVRAIRQKKQSSLVKGMQALKEKQIDGFISAGSTGAILAGGLFIVGRIKGIERPALTSIFPNADTPFVVLDIGANALNKESHLHQFSLLGSAYASLVLSKTNPRVALLNIGSENEKGNEFYQQVYELLGQEKKINFVGNIEANQLFSNQADVIVCDGFTGNILLKSMEGLAKFIFGQLKLNFMHSTRTKIAGILAKPVFSNLKDQLDPSVYGGAPFIGVEGIVIKAHGNSNAFAIKNAIRQAISLHQTSYIKEIKKLLE